ncbi:HEPN domain-containing protein [Acinetobacter sp. WCHAc010052]|uniref:HEPN domain-containing protein n=1 Tax=Acinetobacter sp. WCHAc010052 TaxID=2004647 RepID=UPI000B3BFBA7|nr:HEPN domain-containing protein [Acinetobacter sp. WCHAc010052]AXY61142.1 hypothetical protein CDG61_14655 [Acinetobacter sp. WCHAc010052]
MLVLEEIFKDRKHENTDQFNLRIQRGLSWLKKAIDLDQDIDLKFITLWISFNAVYAQDTTAVQDKQILRQFIDKICHADHEHKIYKIIWEKYSQPVRLFMQNPYAFQEFWDFQNQKISKSEWKEDFESEKNRAFQALENKNTPEMLMMLFSRLSTLKTQLIHGGATHNSTVNRKQLYDGCHLLSALISAFLFLLLENAAILDQGKPFYPVVQMS